MSDIASLALKYQGAGYSFGGSPAGGIGKWDCSSFVNWVVGHDAGMAIPGYAAGSYDGSSHGPVVLDWVTWSGAGSTITPSRGDLCIWPGVGALGHMGVFLAPNQMISALNSQLGTTVTPIQGYGPSGIPVVYKTLSGNSSAGTGCPVALLTLPFMLAKRLL